jgi:hypothetical protein
MRQRGSVLFFSWSVPPPLPLDLHGYACACLSHATQKAALEKKFALVHSLYASHLPPNPSRRLVHEGFLQHLGGPDMQVFADVSGGGRDHGRAELSCGKSMCVAPSHGHAVATRVPVPF